MLRDAAELHTPREFAGNEQLRFCNILTRKGKARQFSSNLPERQRAEDERNIEVPTHFHSDCHATASNQVHTGYPDAKNVADNKSIHLRTPSPI